MSEHGTRLFGLINDRVSTMVAGVSLRRYRVAGIEPDGTLALEDLATGEVDGESYFALDSPTPYEVGNYVMVGEVIGRGSNASSTRVVIGKRGANSPPVVSEVKSQSTADTASTASVTTYANAMTLAVVLPSGTWAVMASGSVLLSHSVNQGSWRIEIDGDAPSPETLSMVTEERFAASHKLAGVAGNRTIQVRVQYRSSTAGTTSARNPSLTVTAIRTG